ncbi:histone-fold-containing protein [Lipomyces oligophaga]|uniref:histone-fold-containing protein n=1 Tax=Lipomyces oligophaga TaxID=45792 RepID=UPI0034D00140
MYSDNEPPSSTGMLNQDQLSPDSPDPVQYDQVLESGGHFGAAAAVAAAGGAPAPTFVGGAFANVAQGLTGQYRNIMMSYWQETINNIERDEHEFKIHQLPLARIKKVMKADEDVKMISAEAPILFAKGCDIFITELTMRAWIHAEENKRRTLQRSDIANALQKSDMFDFLIDIVPREEAVSSSRKNM